MEFFERLLALLRWEKFVGGCLELVAYSACCTLKLVTDAARGVLCVIYEG
jgi:hypothetical protein